MKDLLYPLRVMHGNLYEWKKNKLPLIEERFRNPKAEWTSKEKRKYTLAKKGKRLREQLSKYRFYQKLHDLKEKIK